MDCGGCGCGGSSSKGRRVDVELLVSAVVDPLCKEELLVSIVVLVVVDDFTTASSDEDHEGHMLLLTLVLSSI